MPRGAKTPPRNTSRSILAKRVVQRPFGTTRHELCGRSSSDPSISAEVILEVKQQQQTTMKS